MLKEALHHQGRISEPVLNGVMIKNGQFWFSAGKVIGFIMSLLGAVWFICHKIDVHDNDVDTLKLQHIEDVSERKEMRSNMSSLTTSIDSLATQVAVLNERTGHSVEQSDGIMTPKIIK